MRKKSKLIFGVGINDADYNVYKTEEVNGKLKILWRCPFYSVWTNVLRRCYSEQLKIRNPTYVGCKAVTEWHYFMTFRQWMSEQDWEGKQIDKDILFPGNKTYGPDTCVFISAKVNTFILESTASRGTWPIGVSFDKESGKYKAQCNDINTGKRKNIGRYSEPEEAHEAWLTFKLEQAEELAAEQTDSRVAAALLARYKNYK